MKSINTILIGILLTGMLSGTATAIDINALDKVSVLMTQSKVHSHLGTPHEVIELGNGLKAEIYKNTKTESMVGAGCIYLNDGQLVGQAFVFQGIVNKEAAERLIKHGFVVRENTEGVLRYAGKDDDFGHPLVAHITNYHGMTVIMTFEKGFYDRWGK